MNPTQLALQQTQQQPVDVAHQFINPIRKIIPSPQDDTNPVGQAMDQEQSNQQTPDLSHITQAMGILDSKSTIGKIGKAIATPNYAYSGLCLKWVDDQTGNENRQPTAYADYQAHAQEGDINTDTKDIPKGARVYFGPSESNGGAGHIGLSNGDGTFTSATDNAVEKFSIADWEKYASQEFIGWAK